MAVCPACGAEAPPDATECGTCHLAVALFGAVRDAAGADGAQDPVYMQTVGELIRSVDLTAPAQPGDSEARPGLLDRGRPRRPPAGGSDRPAREPSALRPIDQMPGLPDPPSTAERRRRIDEYRLIARRMGVDLGPLSDRLSAALLTDDEPTLEAIAREMFVHLAAAVAEEYETVLVRRNELAHLVPTPSVDVELDAVRRSIAVGDLAGAHRRLAHVQDELTRLDEEWATGRILATECDLLADTLRDLGGDPAPALGPLEAGRKSLGTGQRESAERLLARAAVALWSLLEPRFFEELKRLRDRMIAARAAGADIGAAVGDLRGIAVELKARNFAGAIAAYRQLRAFVDRVEAPAVEPALDAVVAPVRPAPSA
ncbi:MAG TPA: zinc ribbon domain-containing protein [Thermoplasmata archaeon]|nr:zinc ribbon domain-containing protein [Thermoplasmata archaeon]